MADAVAEVVRRRAASWPRLSDQLTAIEAEVRQADATMEQYFQAFESGSISESVCAPPLQALRVKLSEQRAALRARIEEEGDNRPPSGAELDEFRGGGAR